MSGLFGGKSINNTEQRIGSLRIQSSSQGLPIALVYGKTRVSPNLIGYYDFTAIPHTESQRAGKGGGTTVNNTTFTYTAAMALALSEGPITSVERVWKAKDITTTGNLGLTLFEGTYPQTAWSYLTTNHANEALGYLGTAYLAASALDLGSGASTPNLSFEVGGFLYDGCPDVNPKDVVEDLLTAEHYGAGFPAAMLGNLTTFSNYCAAAGFLVAPAYTAQKSAADIVTELADIGNSGIVWSEGLLKIIPYAEEAVTGNTTTGSFLSGVAAEFYAPLTTDANDTLSPAAGASILAPECIGPYDTDGVVFTPAAADPQFIYEADKLEADRYPGRVTISVKATILATTGGGTGDNEQFLIYDGLDTAKGISFGFRMESGTVYLYTLLNDGGIVTQSHGAADHAETEYKMVFEDDEVKWYAGDVLLRTEAMASFAGTLYILTLDPGAHGVTSMRFKDLRLSNGSEGTTEVSCDVTGNVTYTPDLTVRYDLTRDDFLAEPGEDPIKVMRKRQADAYNQVQVECLNRDDNYNTAVVDATDQWNVALYGRRPREVINCHAICDPAVARAMAEVKLQRALYQRNTYEFRLGWRYARLEPMDIVSLTEPLLGLDETPVRITAIEESEDGELGITAEELLVGVSSAASTTANYSSMVQSAGGYAPNQAADPGDTHAPVIFMPPAAASAGVNQVWIGAAGGANWGGAQVWVSTDGNSYQQLGTLTGPATYGELTANASSAYAAALTLAVPAQFVYESGGYLYGILDGSPASVRKQDATTGNLVAGQFVGETCYAAIHVGNIIYAAVANDDRNGHVVRANAANLSATLVTYNVGAGEPQGIAYDGSLVWATRTYAGSVISLDPTTLALGGTYAIEGGIGAMTYAAGSLWICSRAAGEIIEWDVGTHAQVSRFPCVRFPLDILVVNDLVFVVGANQAAVYDTSGTRVTLLDNVSGQAVGHQAIAHWGSRVAMADWASGEIVLLSDTTGEVTEYIGATGIYGIAGVDATNDRLLATMGTLRSGFTTQIFGNSGGSSNLMQVDLSTSNGTLTSVTAAAANAGSTLSYVGPQSARELVAFSDANLTGAYTYDLETYIARGLDGTVSQAHVSGAPFMRIDDSVGRFDVADSLLGTTIFVKLPGLNVVGQGVQSLDNCTVYTFNIPAASTSVDGANAPSDVFVSLSLPSIFTTSNGPTNLSANLNTQNANTFFAGPASGNAATPTFRSMLPADMPTFNASGANHAPGAVPDPGASTGNTRYLREDATFANVVQSVGLTAPAIFTVSNSPVTTTGNLTLSLVAQNAATFLAGPLTGNATAPTMRAIAASDFNGGTNASNTTFLRGDLTWANAGGIGNIALTVPSFLTVANSPLTANGTLAVSLATQNAALVFASPTPGSNAAAPSFRALAGGDMPALTINTQTANYTLALSDGNGTWVEMNSANALVVTVPSQANVAWAGNVIIPIERIGAGNVTISAQANVTVHNASSNTIRVQYGVVGLKRRGSDEWTLFGDTT